MRAKWIHSPPHLTGVAAAAEVVQLAVNSNISVRSSPIAKLTGQRVAFSSEAPISSQQFDPYSVHLLGAAGQQHPVGDNPRHRFSTRHRSPFHEQFIDGSVISPGHFALPHSTSNDHYLLAGARLPNPFTGTVAGLSAG